MNPSDMFNEFDSMSINDLLPESFEQMDGNNGTGSVSSSFSESYDELPIYRSLDVMSSNVLGYDSMSGIDMVYEPPTLRRGSNSSVESKVGIDSNDLFSALDLEFTNTSLPCVSDPLGGIATTTSVEVVKTLGALTSAISSFLSSRGVHFVHCELSSLWKCQLTNFVDSCKFNIQIYSHDEVKRGDDESATYSIEFLRINGCSILFSKEFQQFKLTQSETKTEDEQPIHSSSADVSHLSPLDLSKGQDALKCFVDWASVDEKEAITAATGLFNNDGVNFPLIDSMMRTSGDSNQISEEGILCMTLLASICAQIKQQQEQCSTVKFSSISLLSILHLLLETKNEIKTSRKNKECFQPLLEVLSTLINSLVPATARLTAVSARNRSRVTPFERDTAVQMMEMIDACA
jgi:hypothetical protein